MQTEWYAGEIKPIRRGVYLVEKSYGIAWAHWNGCTWSNGNCDTRDLTEPKAAQLRRAHNSAAYPVKRWRGLNREV